MSNVAPILQRSAGMICFAVDDVDECAGHLSTEGALTHFERSCHGPLLASSHSDEIPLVKRNGDNPLIAAVHFAFSDHRHLVLTPDVFWITIAQGFASHVNLNAESLRSRFVKHEGRKTLTVYAKEITELAHWENAVAQWGMAVCGDVGPEVYHLLISDFSTTTRVSRTVSQIVMMDAFQQYFEYAMECICGIPAITVTGTVEDWRSILKRVKQLSRYDLGWWTKRVLPICSEILRTMEGHPSRSFWQEIYKPESIYGGDTVTGWIADLFPYLVDARTQRPTIVNPILAIPRQRLRVENGISTGSFPTGLSYAPFKLKSSAAETDLRLVGGLIGVRQYTDNGRLEPEIGWGVQVPPPPPVRSIGSLG